MVEGSFFKLMFLYFNKFLLDSILNYLRIIYDFKGSDTLLLFICSKNKVLSYVFIFLID